MGGAAAVESKIVRRIDESDAEVMMPDAIDDDARRQRIAWIGDPAGEADASRGFGRIGGELELRGDRAQRTNPAGGHEITFSIQIPALEEMGGLGLAGDGGIGPSAGEEAPFQSQLGEFKEDAVAPFPSLEGEGCEQL